MFTFPSNIINRILIFHLTVYTFHPLVPALFIFHHISLSCWLSLAVAVGVAVAEVVAVAPLNRVALLACHVCEMNSMFFGGVL